MHALMLVIQAFANLGPQGLWNSSLTVSSAHFPLAHLIHDSHLPEVRCHC